MLFVGLLPIVTPSSVATTGYGSNSNFLAPITPPITGSIPISTRAQLEAVENNLGGTYHLTNDIDLSGTNWVPIGDNSTNSDNSRFTGIFDGQGYIIRNLRITGDQYEYVGLFGFISTGAIIKNVGLAGTHIDVDGTSNTIFAGGICGRSYQGTIINCYNTGNVSAFARHGSSYSAGICGFASFTNISNCYNTGSVYASAHNNMASSGAPFAGGICGQIQDSSLISNCFNIGDIWGAVANSTVRVGGICGQVQGASSISNCYNTGDVIFTNIPAVWGGLNYGTIGGICGQLQGDSTIINCYWNIDSAQTMRDNQQNPKRGAGTGTDTTTPLTTAQMRQQSSFVGWNFSTIWAIAPNINNGFPYLQEKVSSGSNFEVDEIISASSTTYNPKIALLSADLSAAAYCKNTPNATHEIQVALMEQGFEFDNIKPHHYYFGSLQSEYKVHNTAHTFAWKEVDNTLLIAIVIRGTDHWGSDWLSNLSVTYNIFSGHHSGFNLAMERAYDNLLVFLSSHGYSLQDGNTKYLITGHSRGGAVANLLAVKLSNNGVSNTDVFCYTFGAPDNAVGIGSKWNPSGIHNNIFNICNTEDIVPYVPGAIGGIITPPGFIWGKYGRTTWFSSLGNGIDEFEHNMPHYIDFARNSPTAGSSSNPRSSIPTLITSIKCPVNVQVLDSKGDLVAKIENNELIYYNSTVDKLLILTDDDTKIIVSLNGEEYTFNLTGTDTGLMNLTVSTMNIVTGEVQELKTFADVALFNGKQMKSVIGGGTTTISEIQLFIIDDNLIIGEIKEDGTEIIFNSGNNTDIDSNSPPSNVPSGTFPTDIPSSDTTSPQAPALLHRFIDVLDNAWYAEAVYFCLAFGIMQGVGQNRFEPLINMSRAMFVLLLANYDGADISAFANNPFNDVSDNAWYSNAVAWAYSKGLVSGTSGITFSPDTSITRQEMAVLLQNYIEYKKIDMPLINEKNLFNDDDELDDWAREGIYYMQQAGLIVGKGGNVFDPKGTATKAEVAQLFMNFIKAITKDS